MISIWRGMVVAPTSKRPRSAGSRLGGPRRRGAHAVADLADEAIVDAVEDVQALGADASDRRRCRPQHGGGHRLIQIGIVADDHRILPPSSSTTGVRVCDVADITRRPFSGRAGKEHLFDNSR